MVGMAGGDPGGAAPPERASGCLADASRLYRTSHCDFYLYPRPMPARLFLSSGDLVADRRFDFARDLQLRGDLPAAADLLQQAIELAPGFASAWFPLGEI